MTNTCMSIADDQKIKDVIAALEDSRYKWRTVSGVAKQTSLPEKEVSDTIAVLSSKGLVIHSSIPSENGADLFTTRSHYSKAASLGVLSIFFAVIAEVGLVFWTSSELFSSVERPMLAAVLLLLGIICFVLYCTHKLVEFETLKRYSRPLWTICLLLCGTVAVTFCVALWSLSERLRIAKEPRIEPSVVHLHDGTSSLATRVELFNPSDAPIFKVVVLADVENNVVPVSSVTMSVSEEHVEKFSDKIGIEPFMDSWGMDYGEPDFQGRLRVFYVIRPHETRVLWIRGTMATNSWLNLSVVDYLRHPFPIKSDTNGVVWPGPRKNSPFWRHTKAEPMDLDIKVQVNGPVPSNSVNHLDLPMRR